MRRCFVAFYFFPGTLLGSGREVTNCFAVTHVEDEGDEVKLGKEYHANMLYLHKKSNPQEDVVGWCVGAEIFLMHF